MALRKKRPGVLSMLSMVSDSTTDTRTKIRNIDEILEQTYEDKGIFRIMWTTVEMLLDELHVQVSKSPHSMAEFVEMCQKYEFKLRPFIEAKEIAYADSQSVHIFMKDVRDCVEWVVREYRPIAFARPFEHPFFDIVESSPAVIYEDMTMYDILACVLDYINKSEHKEELLTIMKSEMDQAVDLCVSGRLSAIVNCLYGFPGVPEIRGNAFEHEKSAVFHYLNTHLDLFDIDSINASIALFFTDGRLTMTDNTLSILYAYTGDTWIVDPITNRPTVEP